MAVQRLELRAKYLLTGMRAMLDAPEGADEDDSRFLWRWKTDRFAPDGRLGPARQKRREVAADAAKQDAHAWVKDPAGDAIGRGALP